MKFKTWFAVVFPLVVMLGWTAKLALGKRSGREVTLAIRGFDPRDLLSGHYLRYQVDWGSARCEVAAGVDTCYCVDGEVPATVTWTGACAERPKFCDLYIKGTCQHGTLEAGLNRFFIPETWQGELATVPANASIQAMVSPEGGIVVKSMMVEGLPLASWMMLHKKP